MEHMIQQITIEFVKKLCRHFAERGVYELGAMAANGKEMTSEFVRDLLCVLIEDADKELILEKSERKGDGIQVHERDVPRTQFTSLGPLTYKRTYFDTPDGRGYLLDEILGVNAYERVDTTVSAQMVNNAGEQSFSRSADIVTAGRVSRQTAWKKTMCTGESVVIPDRAKTTPEVLHIFADEDHVHLQDGKGQILPLVTICAGKNPICKNRNELIDPVHINGYALKPDKLWSYVYAVCDAKYDMRKVRKVMVYGDAAPWIGASREFLPDLTYVLDDYHFWKRIKALLAGDVCGAFTLRLHRAIRENKTSAFQKILYEMKNAIFSEMPEGKERDKRLRHVREEGAFLLAHWDGIQSRADPDSIGSCTEALVSHVFSERFSRNPMGWSKAGLEKMTMIRVFTKNGGKIMPFDIGTDKRTEEERRTIRSRIEKYAALVNQQEQELLEEAKNWRWFEHEDNMISQARTGTRYLLRCLGKERGTC